MGKYRTEVYWWHGNLDVRVWKVDVFISLNAETDFHCNLSRFLKIFSSCKAGKWNIYEISAEDLSFLLRNMNVMDSHDFRDHINH